MNEQLRVQAASSAMVVNSNNKFNSSRANNSTSANNPMSSGDSSTTTTTSTDSKLSLSDSYRTDSGYHSSGYLSDLQSRGGLDSDLMIPYASSQSQLQDDANSPKHTTGSSVFSSLMCDSGLDLQDSFSTLSLESSFASTSLSSDADKAGLPNCNEYLELASNKNLWLEAFNQDKDGDTHLHLAIVQGCLDVVYTLIQMAPHAYFLDILNNLYQAPLHLAVVTQQPTIVRWLIVAGANTDLQNRMGYTPLHLACERGDLECVRELTRPVTISEMETRWSWLKQRAHSSSNVKGVSGGVGQGGNSLRLSDLEIRNYEGLRCVHLAAMKGHHHVLQHLKAHGADINAQEGRSGRTPLHLAVEHQNLSVVEFLARECHANINSMTYAGHTPIQLAHYNNAKIADKLQQLGAHPIDLMLSSSSDSESDTDSLEDSMDTEFGEYNDLKINGEPLYV